MGRLKGMLKAQKAAAAKDKQKRLKKRQERKQLALKQQGGEGGAPATGATDKTHKATSALPSRALKRMQQQKAFRLEALSRRRGLGDIKNLEDLQQRATSGADAFQEKMQVEEKKGSHFGELNDNSRRAYMRELKKVVERADVILEVLDARDPEGCRCPDLEDMILSKGGKRLVLVLNKVDLVPQRVLIPWLRHLRRQYPTVAFKANTQEQGGNMAQISGKADKALLEALTGSKAVGTEALMQLLKNYCRSQNIKTAITVGVIGYPNVGKSSVINSLKREKAVGVSATAGFTKAMQEVHLDKKIKLLDCPGIVFDDSDAGSLFLRNCINVDTLSDPIQPVEAILGRCQKGQLEALYGIGDYEDVIDFLVKVAFKRGKLQKGGIPDRLNAARAVLQDWNSGKIPFHTEPPKEETLHLGAAIVSKMGEDFKLEEFLNPQDLMRELPADVVMPMEGEEGEEEKSVRGPVCSLTVEDPGSGGAMEQEERQKEEKEWEDDESEDDEEQGTLAVIADATLTAQQRRRALKNQRKLKRRAQRVGAGSEGEEDAMDREDDFDDL